MMSLTGLLNVLQARSRRTAILIALVLSFISFFSIWLNRAKIDEDIAIMLPREQEGLLRQLKFLQDSPLADKVFILLEGSSDVSQKELSNIASKFVSRLPERFFPKVLGTTLPSSQESLNYFLERLPYLLNPKDLKKIDTELSYEQVQGHMLKNHALLSGSQGFMVKNAVQRDPLNLRRFFLSKLKPMLEFSALKTGKGFVLSPDGQSALISATCSVEPTDSGQTRLMLAEMDKLSLELIDQDIEYSLVSAHAYSAANSSMIRADMQQVLVFSLLGLILIFVVFLRKLEAIWILSVPLCTLLCATGIYALTFSVLSGIVLGFGAVLLGITLDYGVHVYLSLKEAKERRQALKRVFKPLLASALTTCSGFLVLYFSSIEGIRQLSFLAISGIIFACFFALLILPFLLTSSYNLKFLNFSVYQGISPLIWIVFLLLMAGAATQIEPALNLRSVGYFPEDLRQAESRVQNIWGRFKKGEMLVTSSNDLQKGLRQNDQLFFKIRKLDQSPGLLSISPLLPAKKTQEHNLRAWLDFWDLDKQEKLRTWLQNAGAGFGFSKDAFAPFMNTLDRDYTPEKISLNALQEIGLTELADLFISYHDNQVMVYTYPQSEGADNQVLTQAVKGLKDTFLISKFEMQKRIESQIKKDLLFYAVCGLLVIALFLLLIFRNVKEMFRAFLPPLSAVVVLLGVLSLFGVKLNLFHVAAIPLIIGLGVDYGIFMLYWKRGQASSGTAKAVFISALSTIMAFGALTTANHPALHSLGLAVLTGVCAAAFCALLVIPNAGENK